MKTRIKDKDMNKVIICKPGAEAKIKKIDGSLESIQRIVGKSVAMIRPFHNAQDPREDNITIYYNPEAKIKGSLPCRAVTDEDRDVSEIIFGKFFICYESESSETIQAFPEDLEERFLKRYGLPHQFILTDEGIDVCQYSPGFFGKKHVVIYEKSDDERADSGKVIGYFRA